MAGEGLGKGGAWRGKAGRARTYVHYRLLTLSSTRLCFCWPQRSDCLVTRA